jgi:twitching motility protein PilT
MHMDDLLKALISHGGSDLHLMAGVPPAIRKNGHLMPLEGTERLTPEQVEGVIRGVLTEEQLERFANDPHSRYELDFAYGLQGVGRFRFNVHRQRGSMGAVARSLATEIPSMDKLGLPASVAKLTEARKGLALVTGPTGSGKSTTLAAIIDRVNATRADHILTIEDPIEYLHNSKKSYVTQREVGDTADTLSFKNALKHALRQDPDVILIGEMRDYETIGIAITSAETGHLVFGTLHTQSASQTIGRIIDVFPSDQVEQVKTQLGGTLVGVLAQVLLPKKDGKGRVCACEIMFSNHAIRNNIRMNNIDALYQAIQTGSKEGMTTMDQSIVALVKAGTVSYEAGKPYLRDESSHRQVAGFAEAEGSKPAAGGGAPATAGGGNSGGNATGGATGSAVGGNAGNGGAAEAAPQRRTLGTMIKPPWEKD